jgi:hypothetical protein
MPRINTDKMCYVIAKARELESEDERIQSDASNPGGNPLLAAHLESGLAEFGESCEGFADDRE